MLIATAEAASSEEGAEFMEEFYPETYQNESGLRIAGLCRDYFPTRQRMHCMRILTYLMKISFPAARHDSERVLDDGSDTGGMAG